MNDISSLSSLSLLNTQLASSQQLNAAFAQHLQFNANGAASAQTFGAPPAAKPEATNNLMNQLSNFFDTRNNIISNYSYRQTTAHTNTSANLGDAVKDLAAHNESAFKAQFALVEISNVLSIEQAAVNNVAQKVLGTS